MNVICILCDSLNRHFLNVYGTQVAETPNIDWFAQRAYAFDKHFSGSLPTMPTRREVWTGNYEFLWRPWGALEPWDDDLPTILNRNDVLTMLITDSYHLFERGSGNYHAAFEGWELFRGFENDPWVTDPVPTPQHRGRLVDRYARSMSRMQTEKDLPAAKTLRCVEDWLAANRTRERFFLMVDEFSPHEPFNAPDYMVRKYLPDYDGVPNFWPKYGRNVHTEREVEELRAHYAAHVTHLDKYLGRVFETMTDLDLWKNTAVILMTDHGHFLGDHGYTGKPPCPQYDVLAHIPFLMYVPGHESGGAHVSGLSANVDVFATVLDLFDIPPSQTVQARSLLPLVAGSKQSVRDWTLYGYFGRHVDLTDGTHTYMRAPQAADRELYVYSLRWEFRLPEQHESGFFDRLELGKYMPNVDYPVGRIPVDPRAHEDRFENENLLFNIDEDPGQERNLAGGPDESRYTELLTRALREVGAPGEQFRRLGLDG
jgi:arylsulfatase A-like enzyme